LWRINLSGHRLVEADTQTLRLVPNIAVDVRETRRLALGVLEGILSAERCRLSDLILAGPLLPGWYEEWVVTERERLHQLRLHALELLCQQLTAAGRFGQAVEAGLAAVTSEPLRESAHRALIQAYLGEGNHAQAIRQYQVCRQILRRELGIEPSSLTAALVPWARG
jgi:DNA-binding SARP family transcriptional activator